MRERRTDIPQELAFHKAVIDVCDKYLRAMAIRGYQLPGPLRAVIFLAERGEQKAGEIHFWYDEKLKRLFYRVSPGCSVPGSLLALTIQRRMRQE